MFLSDFVEVYASEHDITQGTQDQYSLAARSLEAFVGRKLELSEVTPDQVNQHLRKLKTEGKADSTRHSRRRDLNLLLRAAVERGEIASFDFAKMMRVKVADRITRAWTREQVEHLVSVAWKMKGKYKCGVPKCLWWRSFILASFDTGLRSCDLLQTEFEWVKYGGCFTVVQRKTGHRHRVQFSAGTRQAIAESMAEKPDRVLVWPLWGRRECFCKNAKRLIKLAGLPGTMKWLRRASATAMEMEHPGCAGRHLGHKTPGLAERHYIDYDQLALNRPALSPLVG